MITSADQLSVGDTIRFKFIINDDFVYWIRTIQAVCKHKAAKAFSDVDAYYLDIKKTNSSLPVKEALTYLVLDVIENDGSITSTRAFAIEWMDPSTLELVEEDSYSDIRIYNVSDAIKAEIIKYITNDLHLICEDITEE